MSAGGPPSWREHAVSPWSWQRAPNQAGGVDNYAPGEAGGFFVRCEALGGCRAYLKPLRRGNARAAREKIVSDLAADLALSVPPVLLWKRTDHQSGEEEHTCVSRVMFPRQWPWHIVKRFVIDPSSAEHAAKIVLAALPRAAAEGLALDTWVSQPDHNDHPHNIIFGYSPGATPNGTFLFLDFAFALGFNGVWDNGMWSSIPAAPFPPHMVRYLDPTALGAIVERIEGISPNKVRDVVTRIPTPYLDEQQKGVIIEGLLGRQRLVRTLLADHLQSRGSP